MGRYNSPPRIGFLGKVQSSQNWMSGRYSSLPGIVGFREGTDVFPEEGFGKVGLSGRAQLLRARDSIKVVGVAAPLSFRRRPLFIFIVRSWGHRA